MLPGDGKIRPNLFAAVKNKNRDFYYGVNTFTAGCASADSQPSQKLNSIL